MTQKLDLTKVKIDRRAFKIDQFLPLLERELRNTAARLQMGIERGQGADGQEIKPGGYSESYLKKIRAGKVIGRNEVRKVSETVDLTVTGELLRSWQPRKGSDGKSVELYMNDSNRAKIAGYLHNMGFTGWFEYGKVDLQRIEKSVIRKIEELMAAIVQTK